MDRKYYTHKDNDKIYMRMFGMTYEKKFNTRLYWHRIYPEQDFIDKLELIPEDRLDEFFFLEDL